MVFINIQINYLCYNEFLHVNFSIFNIFTDYMKNKKIIISSLPSPSFYLPSLLSVSPITHSHWFKYICISSISVSKSCPANILSKIKLRERERESICDNHMTTHTHTRLHNTLFTLNSHDHITWQSHDHTHMATNTFDHTYFPALFDRSHQSLLIISSPFNSLFSITCPIRN